MSASCRSPRATTVAWPRRWRVREFISSLSMVIARFQGAYRTGGASRVLAASTGHDTRPMPAVRAWLGLCIAAAGAAGDTGVESRPPSAMVGLGGSGRVAPSGDSHLCPRDRTDRRLHLVFARARTRTSEPAVAAARERSRFSDT